MEENNVRDADSAAGSAANVNCQDEGNNPSQKEILQETKYLISGQLASMDTANSPLKEASSNQPPFKLRGKSPKFRTPVKNHKLNPFKSTKKLFISPPKRKESKACALKRRKSSELSPDEAIVKSKKHMSNKSEKRQLTLQDEDVVAQVGDGIDESLENKAAHANLTAKNVKSVIHHVLTNEQVLKMFKDVLESDQQDTSEPSGSKKIDVAAAGFDYLPKMTRARVREFLEKISMLSPVKAAREGPSIMDVEFNEEEDDDDEYNPEKDEECHESDDESITSSKLSEFGSPYRDFLSTSFMTPSRDVTIPERSTVTKETSSNNVTESDLPSGSVENILTIDTELTAEEPTDGIALRTRSKQPLTSTSITELEDAFVAPDITTDMYDNYCDDADYAQFLSTLFKTTDDAMTDDDADANDPEFNYISEVEREQVDEEDFRFDKPTKVTKKELAEMFEQLHELFEDEDLPYQVVAAASEVTGGRKMQPCGQDMPSSLLSGKDTRSLQPVASSSSVQYTTAPQPERSSSASYSKFKTPHPPPPHPAPSTFASSDNNSVSNADANAIVTPEQRALIKDNIRKHIQLLLQSYMLCEKSPLFVQVAADSKSLIEEVSYLRHSSCVGESSTFNVCNLDPAVELLSKRAVVKNSEVEKPKEEPVWILSQTQKLAIINSPAFVYPRLLPLLTKPKSNERKYNKFFLSEDNLIAIGLEQFRKCKDANPVELLHQLLLRGKTHEQVYHRVQYLSSGKVGDNAVKAVKRTGVTSLPKPEVDDFYTAAPKDQPPSLLPSWCSSIISGCKVGAQTNTNLPQPAFIDQLSQQEHSRMSDLRTHIPHEMANHMQQIAPSQIQLPATVSTVTQPITFNTSPSVQLPTGLPPIAGIYIQFSASTAAGPQVLPAVTLPSVVPSMPAVLESRPRSAFSHNRKSTKRKITLNSSTLGCKKQRVQAAAEDGASVSNSSTPTHPSASPDLLAKTMLSCGIQGPVCPSPQAQFQCSHDLDQVGMSFASSTPIAQDKHPSVRNLRWEFDAAHRQSLYSVPDTQTQNNEKAYSAQSKASCSQVSACQTVVLPNDTTATSEPRSCLVSPLHHNEPEVNGEPQKNKTRVNEYSHLLPYTNSSSVSNHDLLPGISKHTAACEVNDFDDSFGGTSQDIFSSSLPQTSEMVNLETKKQSPVIVDEKNSQEHELSRANQTFSDFSSQGHLQMDITIRSQTENMDVVDSGLASDSTSQNDNGTCEAVQADLSAQSVINLSVLNDKDSLNNDREACEIVQDKSAQYGINLSVPNDVPNDKDSLHNVTEACEIARDDSSAQSVINLSGNDDKQALNNVIETDSIFTADAILTVLTDDSSSSIDKTLICASDNTSDNMHLNMSDSSVRQTQSKPKTVRQILEASERSKPHTATNISERSKPHTSINTSERSKPHTSTNTSERSKPHTSTNTSERSKPQTAADTSERSKPHTATDTSERSKSHTFTNTSERSKSHTSTNTSERSKSHTATYTSQRHKSHTSTNTSERNKSHTSTNTSERSKPHTSTNTSERNKSHTSTNTSERSKPHTSTNTSERRKPHTSTDTSERSKSHTATDTSERSKPHTSTNTSERSKPHTSTNTSERREPQTATNTSERSKPHTATNTSERSKPHTSTDTSERSKPHTVTDTSERSKLHTSTNTSERSKSHTSTNTSERSKSHTSTDTSERSKSHTSTDTSERSKPHTSTNTSILIPDGDTAASDSTHLNMSEGSVRQTQLKPKTVRQILEASERSKPLATTNTSERSEPHSATNTSILTPDAASDTVNQNIEPIIITSDNSSMNQPAQSIILINGNNESSSYAEQANTSPPSPCFSVTTPALNSVALIGLQSPVKHSDSSINSIIPSPFKTPTKFRPLIPKTSSSAASTSSSYVPLPKTSPKRKELNKHVRQILPKSFVFEVKTPSPTKTAAQVLKKKATLFCQNRSPVKLLPKQPLTSLSGPTRSIPLLTPTRMFTRSQKTKGKSAGKKNCKKTALPVVKDPEASKEKATVEPMVVESEDAVLSQEEEEEDFETNHQSQLDDLMAASTTIGYDPKKGSSGSDNDNKSKAEKKKDVCLSMLESDIIDRDSKKDERDTAYAQHYFTHIKQVLGDDAERFKKFLTILHDMNRNHMSPVELYADMATLLSGHQDLVDDFAGFLLSFQAVECNCFVSYMEYQQILTFLRRLEIYCDSSNLTYQRTLRMMSRWLTMLNQEVQEDPTPLKEKIAALLRHVPNIADLQSYFFGTPLPDSHPDDFDEVDLDEKSLARVDEFEEITLPEGREDYNTKLCSCHCHLDQEDEKLHRRIKHCYSCSLKIFDGKPVLKTSRNEYRPIAVFYPLEEKKKLVKAKKEAAKLALAKARAQKQRKKRKGKRKNVGNLKCKNSKSIPLKKKFQRRKRCKSQSSSADVGNISMSVTEIESKISNVQDGVSTNSETQEKSDPKITYSKPSDDQYKTSSGKQPEMLADSSGFSSAAKTSIDAENSDAQLTLSSTKDSGNDTISHASTETTVISTLENKLGSDALVLKKEDVCTSVEIKVEVHYDAELLNSRLMTTSASSHKVTTPFSDPYESKPSPVTSGTSAASLDHSLADSDFQNNKQQPQVSTSELNISQTQILPNVTHSVSCMSSALTLSQINSLDTPIVSFTQASADRPNVNRTDTQLKKTVVSSQNTTYVSFGLQPRFSTSPMLTSPRIPVLVTIAPQQYLSSAKTVGVNEVYKPKQKYPQISGVTTSVISPQQVRSTKPDGKYGSHKKETDPSHNLIYSHPVCTQTLTSSSSSLSSSLPCSAQRTDVCIVPRTDNCSTSTTSFANVSSPLIESAKQAVNVSVFSHDKLVAAADLQLSDTISSLPTTPVKDRIPAAVVRAHLDNFSLGAFDTSIGFSQLQQFSLSPSKLLTDSVTKFDLLALIESSNVASKDFTLQSCLAGSSSRTTAEPLLTFSGALEKLRANSDKPLLPAPDTLQEPHSIPAPVTAENLQATPDVTRTHSQPNCGPAIGDDRQSCSIKDAEDDLQNLCPNLNPSKVLMDDEFDDSFVLSVWTEEQDRTILNLVAEGVTQETLRKLHSEIPAKSVEEINSRARLLLQMLEQMGDTESDTDTDASQF